VAAESPDVVHVDLLAAPPVPLRLDGNAWVSADGSLLGVDEDDASIRARITGDDAGESVVLPVLAALPASCEETLPVTPDPTEISFARSTPNPVRGAVAVDYALPAGFLDRVVVDVYDIRGARVRRLEDRVQSTGRYEVGWELLDSAGRRVSTGVYFLHLRAGGDERTRKIVVLR
jgi:hypothetical protein